VRVLPRSPPRDPPIDLSFSLSLSLSLSFSLPFFFLFPFSFLFPSLSLSLLPAPPLPRTPECLLARRMQARARTNALAARGSPRHATAACHALHAFHAVPKPAVPPAVSTITAFLCPPSPPATHTRALLAQRHRLAARAVQCEAKLSSRSLHVLILPCALTLPEPSRHRCESRAAPLRDAEHH